MQVLLSFIVMGFFLTSCSAPLIVKEVELAGEAIEDIVEYEESKDAIQPATELPVIKTEIPGAINAL